MIHSTLPLNIPDLMVTSLHFLYISLSTILLCLASYIPIYLSIILYFTLLNYLCPRPQTDDLYQVLRIVIYCLTIFFHFSLLGIFALPQEGNPGPLAPSVAWACAWTVSLSLVGTTTVFIIAILILKPLQLLGHWPTSEATQSWIYDSSKRENKAGNGGKAPIVRLEMKDGGSFGDTCEHTNDEAVLTIKSLCKDLKAGRTLAVHRAGTGGMRNEDFIGFFHLFGTEGGSRETIGKKER